MRTHCTSMDRTREQRKKPDTTLAYVGLRPLLYQQRSNLQLPSIKKKLTFMTPKTVLGTSQHNLVPGHSYTNSGVCVSSGTVSDTSLTVFDPHFVIVRLVSLLAVSTFHNFKFRPHEMPRLMGRKTLSWTCGNAPEDYGQFTTVTKLLAPSIPHITNLHQRPTAQQSRSNDITAQAGVRCLSCHCLDHLLTSNLPGNTNSCVSAACRDDSHDVSVLRGSS